MNQLKMSNKNLKDHTCIICEREFKSVRHITRFCSRKCYSYYRTKKYMKNIISGIIYDPHNPTEKLRKIIN